MISKKIKVNLIKIYKKSENETFEKINEVVKLGKVKIVDVINEYLPEDANINDYHITVDKTTKVYEMSIEHFIDESTEVTEVTTEE